MTDIVHIDFHISPESMRALESLPGVFEQAMTAHMESIVSTVRSNIQIGMREQEPPLVDTGALWGSITPQVTVEDGRVTGVVGTPLEYGRVQEYGTLVGPHWVPFRVAPGLYDWARRKLGWQVPRGSTLYARSGDGDMYLQPPGGGRLQKGLRVSGRKRPFIHPGFVRSLDYIRVHLGEALGDAIRIARGGVTT